MFSTHYCSSHSCLQVCSCCSKCWRRNSGFTCRKPTRCFTSNHAIITHQYVRALFTHSLTKFNICGLTPSLSAPWSSLSSNSLPSALTAVPPKAWSTISTEFISSSASYRCSTSTPAVPFCTTAIQCETARSAAPNE